MLHCSPFGNGGNGLSALHGTRSDTASGHIGNEPSKTPSDFQSTLHIVMVCLLYLTAFIQLCAKVMEAVMDERTVAVLRRERRYLIFPHTEPLCHSLTELQSFVIVSIVISFPHTFSPLHNVLFMHFVSAMPHISN